ncbi:hypothetical protein [Streptomyces sp. NPDC050355]|uniref:hypothetical protein n=1 Tax=Streptomyces sp. NPDC050355 TaxID=3365609 RepID=UPI00379126AA
MVDVQVPTPSAETLRELYPPVEPYDTGMLDVGDGNLVYWEVCGNPQGKPALVVHGGPGSGCTTGVRRYFDPDRYRVVLCDAADWCAWEDAVLSLEPSGSANPYGDRPSMARLGLVRIRSHYFSHGAWLEEGALLRDAGRLAGIPGVLVHGRQDLGSPLHTAWELARAWPTARLTVIHDAGHKGSGTMRHEVIGALDRFAANGTPESG